MKNLKWTDSLYLALSEEDFEDVILAKKPRDEWNVMRSRKCTDNSTANDTDNFFPWVYCNTHKKHGKREPGFFKEEFTCIEMFCLFTKTYCCYDRKSNRYKFSSKGPNKRTLEHCGEGPMFKYRKVFDESVNGNSNNRGCQRVE